MKNYANQTPATKRAQSSASESVTKVYNVSTAKMYVQDGIEKTFWTNIGTAFSGSKGISIEFNALPLSGKVMLFEKTEQDPRS